MNRLIAVAAAGMLGCATPPAYNTPSGGPEVLIQGRTKSQILAALQDVVRSKGEEVKKATDDSLRTEKKFDAPTTGSNRYSLYRIFSRRDYRLLEDNGAVRVVCTTQKVHYDQNERATDTTRGPGGKDCMGTLTLLQEKLK